LATLDHSSLQEQLLMLRQQVVGATAQLNNVLAREGGTEVRIPDSLESALPDWDPGQLREALRQAHPELIAAQLRTEATRWGIEVARLRRRPDLTFGAGWMVMKAHPADTEPGAGEDSWTLGVTATLPIWHRKYDAMQAEAAHEHQAAHATETAVQTRLDAQLQVLWGEALATQETIRLYEQSILPQARQVLEANQLALVNNAVTFERVIRDHRTVLTLERSYHKAIGQLATTLARIRQTVGSDLPTTTSPAD
jgi:outer membrane protein TolC